MHAKNIHIHLYWEKIQIIRTRHKRYQYSALLGIHEYKIYSNEFWLPQMQQQKTPLLKNWSLSARAYARICKFQLFHNYTGKIQLFVNLWSPVWEYTASHILYYKQLFWNVMNFPTFHNPCSISLRFHVGISELLKRRVMFNWYIYWSVHLSGELELSLDSQRFSAILCHVPPSQVVKSIV